jgi:hypothetical protein
LSPSRLHGNEWVEAALGDVMERAISSGSRPRTEQQLELAIKNYRKVVELVPSNAKVAAA